PKCHSIQTRRQQLCFPCRNRQRGAARLSTLCIMQALCCERSQELQDSAGRMHQQQE
ncbi:hypothetical protein LDENG_00057340, partial [Lucifuga dentata]